MDNEPLSKTAQKSVWDVDDCERAARRAWGERQEDCAKYGADIPMPTIEVPVDSLVEMIRASRTKTPAPDRTTREDVARIIDPKGWETCDRHHNTESAQMYVKDSLAKADAILALIKPPPSCGSDEIRATVAELRHEAAHSERMGEEASAVDELLAKAADLITTLAQRVEELTIERDAWKADCHRYIAMVHSAVEGAQPNWSGDYQRALDRATTAEAALAELKAQGAWMAEQCIAVMLAHRPDASFDDSAVGHVEREALLANIAAEIRASAPARPLPRLDNGWRPAVTDLIAYANDVRWIELAQGMAFGGDDRAMVAGLIAKAKAAKQALPPPPQVDGEQG